MLLAVKRTLNNLSMSMRANEVLEVPVARWAENSRYNTEVAQHLFRTSQSHFRVCSHNYVLLQLDTGETQAKGRKE
jgi:hypothetical protein